MFKWLKNEFKEGKTLISYGGLRVGGQGLNFLVPIILAVKLAPEIFGVYSLGMMIIYFFNITFINSSNAPFIIFGSEEIKKNQRLNHTVTSRLFLLACISIIFLAIMMLFKKQFIDFTKLSNVQFYFLIFVFAGKLLENFFVALFLSFNKRVVASLFQLMMAGLSVLYIIILYLFFTVTLELVFLMFLIAPLISICFFIPQIDFNQILPLVFDKELIKKMADQTKWMMLGGSGIYLLNWGDNIILRQFSTMQEIGVYNLGYQFFKGTVMLMTVLSVYFLPFVSQHIENKEKIANYLQVKRVKLLFLGVIFLGLLFLIMPEFVKILYKNRYADSVVVFRVLTIGAIFAFYGIFYDPVFLSMEKFRATQTIVVVCVVFNLTLDYILVGRIGFMGAAIATSITYFLMAMIKEVYFRKYCRSIVA